MRLSTKGRYAVMAIVDLAQNSWDHGQVRPVTLADISQRQEISLSYLEQLFAKMRRAELVHSYRGPGGGYILARPADLIRVSDVVAAVDEPLQTTRCDLAKPGGCMSKDGKCDTHDLWEELGQQLHKFLSSVSLADIIEKRLHVKSVKPCQTAKNMVAAMSSSNGSVSS